MYKVSHFLKRCSGTSTLCRLLCFFIVDLISAPKIAPKAIPDRWAMWPVLLGMKTPTASTTTQTIPAMNIGMIRPKAQTFIVGLRIVRVPMMPMMAPEAPRDEG